MDGVSMPWGLVMFAGTMVSFVSLRKAGKAHLLMPHQRSIGIAVGITMASSALAAAGVLPQGGPDKAEHLVAVLLPQQAIFALSLPLRGETGWPQTGLALACLLATVGLLFARATEQGETNAFMCAASAALLAATILPSLNTRFKIMLGLWSALLLATVFAAEALPPMPLLLVVEQLALLNVKLQFLPTSESKRKGAGWSW